MVAKPEAGVNRGAQPTLAYAALVDDELIAAARELIEARGDDENHTVAAAARTGDGRIIKAVNVYHFTGGPAQSSSSSGSLQSAGAVKRGP